MSTKRLPAIALVGILALGAILIGACRPAMTSIDVRGSDTMINLGARWAETFMVKNAKYTVAVQGGGSGTGISALINKNTDIAQASRAMKQEEKDQCTKAGFEAREFVVAYDGVAMVVNPTNPVADITVQELAAVFRGQLTNWKDLGGNDEPIVVLSRDTSSGTHVFVKEHIVQEGGKVKGAEYGASVQFLTSSQAIRDEVSQNPKAIGYVGLGYVDAKVKALAVKADADSPAVVLSVATVKDKTYTISRPLYNYTHGEPTGLVKTYLDWIMGPQGQQIVAELGFVPIK